MSGMVDAASKGKMSKHWQDWDGNDMLFIQSWCKALLTILMQTVGLVQIVTESAGNEQQG